MKAYCLSNFFLMLSISPKGQKKEKKARKGKRKKERKRKKDIAVSGESLTELVVRDVDGEVADPEVPAWRELAAVVLSLLVLFIKSTFILLFFFYNLFLFLLFVLLFIIVIYIISWPSILF